MVAHGGCKGLDLSPEDADSYLASLAGCLQTDPPERRGHLRYRTDTAASAVVLTPRRSAAFPVRIVDIGGGGMGVFTSRPQTIGSRIQLSTELVDVIGRVMWSRDSAAGLQIEDIRMRKPAA